MINKWVIVLFLNTYCLSANLFLGDKCYNSNTNKTGTCRYLTQCREELNHLKKNIKPQLCGFEGLETIVCCSEIESVISPDNLPGEPIISQGSLPEEAIVSQGSLPGVISNKKCEEYSKLVYATTLNPTLLVGGGTVKANQCFLENEELLSPPYTVKKEFPHMAAIGFGKTEYSKLDWLCSGTLLSDKHVLTAAHCTVSKSGPPQKVRLGDVSLEKRDEHVQEIEVDRFVTHPKYKIREKHDDIAILFLKNAVVFSAYVRPACLKSTEELIESNPLSVGFLKYRNDYGDKSTLLLKTNMNIVPRETCSQNTGRRQTVTDDIVCAESTRSQFGSCQESSEGILQVLLKKPYCMYGVIGVPIEEICRIPYPFITYSKIESYIAWIESTVWTEDNLNKVSRLN